MRIAERLAADAYAVLRQRFSGDLPDGAGGAMRNWDDLLAEVKELTQSESSAKARQAYQRMLSADRTQPPNRKP